MSTVFLYGFNATYSGESEYEWIPPEPGANHDCLLFFYQQLDTVDLNAAKKEIERYGFPNITKLRGNSLKVEVLNTPTYKGFSQFYEGAIEDGSVLVYYPNT